MNQISTLSRKAFGRISDKNSLYGYAAIMTRSYLYSLYNYNNKYNHTTINDLTYADKRVINLC